MTYKTFFGRTSTKSGIPPPEICMFVLLSWLFVVLIGRLNRTLFIEQRRGLNLAIQASQMAQLNPLGAVERSCSVIHRKQET